MVDATFAEAGDTWGISGPAFVWLYLAVAGVVLAGVLLTQYSTLGPRPGIEAPGTEALDADPYLVAVLDGDERRARLAATAALRVAGLVNDAGQLARSLGRRDLAGRPALERALLTELSLPKGTGHLGPRPTMDAATDEPRDRLVELGLLLDGRRQRRYRRCADALFVVLCLGLARLVSGLLAGRPVGYLVVCLVVVATAWLWVRCRPVPRRTRLGEASLVELRLRHGELAPSMRPSWTTYGPSAAALGVALFGPASLWTADPGLA
jgi:uncharacterized protein (TIGR04222 family)